MSDHLGLSDDAFGSILGPKYELVARSWQERWLTDDVLFIRGEDDLD
jgi:hypothetical protein